MELRDHICASIFPDKTATATVFRKPRIVKWKNLTLPEKE